jgi:hypothetical protein
MIIEIKVKSRSKLSMHARGSTYDLDLKYRSKFCMQEVTKEINKKKERNRKLEKWESLGYGVLRYCVEGLCPLKL